MSRPEAGTPLGSASGFGALALSLWLMFNRGWRMQLAHVAGHILGPAVGFGGKYPVLTVALTAALLVVLGTAIRQLGSNAVEDARETHRLHVLAKALRGRGATDMRNEREELLRVQQRRQMREFRRMPFSLLMAAPLFLWLAGFVARYPAASMPWNPAADLSGRVLLPNWVVLQLGISIPLGGLLSRGVRLLQLRRSGTSSPRRDHVRTDS